MSWSQTGEIDVYDERGNRYTLRQFTALDASGNVIRQEYRTSSGMVAKQLSETEFQWPGAKKFRLIARSAM